MAKLSKRLLLGQIDINNPGVPESPLYKTRNIENRSIVPWDYELIKDNERIPSKLHNVTCSNHCVGYERTLNAVPIQRQILVLRKIKGNLYTLQTVILTVGCTCVHPEIIEVKP
ncbi:interleukin-17F-like [Xenopus laevis]|uniref:Interleukin-17F-like n=1 Tax=Xenopus laevis TaxID=8355 RepID=A0A8J0VJI4_XENLA|nr:interleukin-17F-like [Xenopus laevis]